MFNLTSVQLVYVGNSKFYEGKYMRGKKRVEKRRRKRVAENLLL